MSHAARQAMILGLTLTLVCVAGCQSSPRLVKGHAREPATPLPFAVETEGVELAVTGLIAFGRPGSWKKGAYWDEYIVSVENHRLAPIVMEELVLRDALDRIVTPGADPWLLEKTGREHEQYLIRLGAPAEAGASARPIKPLGPIGKAGTVTIAAAGLVALNTPTAAGIILYGAPLAIVAATPLVLADQVFIAPGNRKLVLAEFNRRRLALPIKLEPGASVAGSVFFPLTPGPEQLTLRGRAGNGPFEVTVTLPGLEGLHFTFVPDKAALQAATPYRGFLRDGPRKLIPERTAEPALPAEARSSEAPPR